MPNRVAVLACAAFALAGLLAPSPASAEDAPFVDWSSLLPAAPGTFQSSREKDCLDGSRECVVKTLDQMNQRFARLHSTCDHNAVFSLTYIRVTEIYQRADLAGAFDEPKFFAHEDAVFARMYHEAYDAWAAGRRDRVPDAWKVAFDQGRARAESGLGNILHGINAHVNRDMPLMLAALGLVRPDGGSRKADHDRFNRLLNTVYDEVLDEIAGRFDPSVKDFDTPGPADNTGSFQLLPAWREGVWRNAESLVNAPTPDARKAVVESIENYARQQAEEISRTFGYGPGQSSAARDAHCARNRVIRRGRGGLARPVTTRGGLRMNSGGIVRLPLRCPQGPGDCAGAVAIRTPGGRRLGAAPISLRAGERGTVSIRLSALGRRIAARRGGARLVLYRRDRLGRINALRRATFLHA